jgi:hypothetical protein
MDASTPNPRTTLVTFVEEMLDHAKELHRALRSDGADNDIKERITCLKYLEDIVKIYLVIKKGAADDPAAAGATVRKYAAAFSENATGGRKKNSRRKPAAPDPDELDRAEPAADSDQTDLEDYLTEH